MPTRILITGGAGFIGHHLVRRMVEQGDSQVVIIDNLSNSNKNFDVEKSGVNVTFYKEDIRNREAVNDIVKRERIDSCVHLAAKISHKDSVANPLETVDVNVNGTLSVLDACAKNNVKSFIFASSAAVYGEAMVLPIPEEHVLKPLSPYGASKVAAEALITSYQACGKIEKAIMFRFFNVYGEGQSPEYAGVITKFAERISQGLSPVIFGTGEQTRDFVSVKDVINAISTAQTAYHGTADIFNIGTGRPTSINQLAKRMIEKMSQDHLDPIYAESQEAEIKQSYAKVKKANEVLGFRALDVIDSHIKDYFININTLRMH